MKNSTKFVWIVIGVIVVILFVLTVMIRSIISTHIVVSNEKLSFNTDYNSGVTVSEEYSLVDFNRIEIDGGWDVLVIADKDFSVTAETREGSKDLILVEKRGHTLYLGLKDPEFIAHGNFHGASVTIYMPELKSAVINGAINMNVEDFNADRIDFHLDGTGQIIGENCSIDNLFVETNGAVNLDFSDSRTKNAEVNVEGAGNIMLNMTGGELTGTLAGLSCLEYSGEVSRLDVEKDGIGGISHKN